MGSRRSPTKGWLETVVTRMITWIESSLYFVTAPSLSCALCNVREAQILSREGLECLHSFNAIIQSCIDTLNRFARLAARD